MPRARGHHAAGTEALVTASGLAQARTLLKSKLVACGLTPSEATGPGFKQYLAMVAAAPVAGEDRVLNCLGDLLLLDHTQQYECRGDRCKVIPAKVACMATELVRQHDIHLALARIAAAPQRVHTGSGPRAIRALTLLIDLAWTCVCCPEKAVSAGTPPWWDVLLAQHV